MKVNSILKPFQQHWLSLALVGFISFSANMGLSGSAYAEGALKQNFKDVDITTVIEAVAKVSGRNFVIDPRVKGKVTLIAPEGMDPDALFETLLAVLNVHGYVAVPSDDVIKIVPANLARDQLPYRTVSENNEDWVTEVVGVHHVESSKLVAILRPLVAREGHLVALSESNKLIITDTVANIKRIKGVLKRVDIDTQGDYEVISITNASAEEVAKTLKGLIPKGEGGNEVKVSFDARSNSVILTGDEQKRVMLRTLISDLDVKVASEGRVQVVYLRYAKAIDLVPILQKIAGNGVLGAVGDDGSIVPLGQPAPVAPSVAGDATAAPIAAAGVQVPQLDNKKVQDQINIEADERMNALIISAPTTIVTALKGVIKQLDIRRAQVLIEAIFVEISANKAANLGVEWGFAGNNGVGLLNFSNFIPNAITGVSTGTLPTIGNGLNLAGGEVASDGNSGWGAFINALNTDSSSNILATPSILTLDNEEAEIMVGREVPFQTGSYASTTTAVTNPFTTIERKNVGLKLKVKPQINEGNEIYLDIDQEVSDVLPKSDAVDLETTKRQIKTRVIVGDGKVIVLGGLISEKETQGESKVPGLGDLPGLGGLFRSTSNAREKVNLMVFLRPIIIRNNTMSDYYSQKKYSYVYQEQDDLLENHDPEMLEGLRPRLPTAEQWEKSEPAEPFVSKKARDRAAPEKEESKPLIVPMTTDELLGR